MSRYDNMPIEQLAEDELYAIPLRHQWYRAERLVRLMRSEGMDRELQDRYGGADNSKRGPNAKWMRGWYRFAHGESVWVNAATVDEWLTEFDLHLWMLGRPDLLSANPPTNPNPTPAQLKARVDAQRRRQARKAARRAAQTTTTEIGVAA